jgi:hypothetical protein
MVSSKPPPRHATPRGVAAWTCTRCGMNWAITLVNHGQRSAAYFEQLDATVEQLDATRSVLRQVITLADDAATLSDKSCGTGRFSQWKHAPP